MPRRDEPSEAHAELSFAARALSSGDPLRALGFVGRSESASGLLLRGVAYAQIGDLELARAALGGAIAAAKEPLVKARAAAALVEVDLEAGDRPLGEASSAAAENETELARLGDVRNARMQRLVRARAEVLLGRLDIARYLVDDMLGGILPPDVRAVALLASAEIAVRAIETNRARAALVLARQVLAEAPNALLARALVGLEEELSRPIARLVERGVVREADAFVIEAASSGDGLLVDACRRVVLGGRATIPLARRPVLFALVRALALAWPGDVPRDALAAEAFEARRVNASHRSRLRVEIGRLRKALDGLGAVPTATADGYTLASERTIRVLLPPSDDEAAALLLLLGDGAAWSAQSLAEHTATSKRTVQRALADLVERGVALKIGAGKTLRYRRPGTPIASRMLLLGLVPKP